MKISNNSSAATNILNERKLAPIHLATELNKVDALKVMAKFSKQYDVQQGGEHGRTALHLAAMYDHEDCAKILVGKILILCVFTSYFSTHRSPSLELRRGLPATWVGLKNI